VLRCHDTQAPGERVIRATFGAHSVPLLIIVARRWHRRPAIHDDDDQEWWYYQRELLYYWKHMYIQITIYVLQYQGFIYTSAATTLEINSSIPSRERDIERDVRHVNRLM
jgi:hypothetical protein